MKAKIKTMGEVVEIFPYYYDEASIARKVVFATKEGEIINSENLDFVSESKEPDWEQRTFDALVAIMASIYSNEKLRNALIEESYTYGEGRNVEEYLSYIAINQAKALVAEYRKGE